ncbi:PASTA domain-containing protein [Streptomyces sp. NPDC092307]|uniref:PASTA domain-containing protein n=1 Tax=Streptomyces sp. NPDC092307 TaxID=3366013 RepID=UPI003828F5A6
MSDPHATQAGVGLRLIRAAVFTAVCVVLSAIGHALASCATVPWWSLCLGFLAVFAVAAPLAGRRRTLPGIAAALTAGQLGLHAMFGLGQHGAAAAQAPAGTADASLAELAARLVCGGNSVPLSPADARQILEAAGLDPAALAEQTTQAAQAGQVVAQGHEAHAHVAQAVTMAPATGLFSPAMLAGHLLAALAAGWLLGRGDAALFRLVELSRRSAEAAPIRPLRAALAFVRALGAGLPASAPRTPQDLRTGSDPARRTGREALQHTVIRRGPPVAFTLAA